MAGDRKADMINAAAAPSHEGGNMFESEQPATKSNLTTLAVVFVVLAILLAATWYFTHG